MYHFVECFVELSSCLLSSPLHSAQLGSARLGSARLSSANTQAESTASASAPSPAPARFGPPTRAQVGSPLTRTKCAFNNIVPNYPPAAACGTDASKTDCSRRFSLGIEFFGGQFFSQTTCLHELERRPKWRPEQRKPLRQFARWRANKTRYSDAHANDLFLASPAQHPAPNTQPQAPNPQKPYTMAGGTSNVQAVH